MTALRLTTLLLLASLASGTWAATNTFYRCVDASGATLYTNQKEGKGKCTVLSVSTVPTPAGKSAPGSGATRTPTPADFPKVGQNEQHARDTDRRSILETELTNERTLLDTARKQGSPDAIALHERNIEALNKEMSKLR